MSKIGDLFVRLGLKNDEFKKGLDDSVKKTESAGAKMKKNWKAIAGGVAAAAAAVRAFANAFSKIAEFEQANANLATILGVSVDKMKDLTDSAKALGRTTEYTASQVTGLQTELAKLGFNGSQIKDMQASILSFATAVGTDLSSAAALTGSTLRGFGLSAKDTEEVLGALAVSTNKSALSFSTLQSGLSIVMPVANAFGFSVKDTIALLGTLTNAGFDASSAATATRNIILYLSDSNSKLNKLLGTQVKTLPELVSALQDLKAKGADLNATLDATDKRAVAAFNALMDGAGSTLELRNALEDTSGELQRISTERLNTVSGSVKILQSAWEGLILSLSNSTGVIKKVLDLLTEFVSTTNEMFFKEARMSSQQGNIGSMLSDFAAKNGEDAGQRFAQGLLDAANARLAQSRGRSGFAKVRDWLYSGGANSTKRYEEQYIATRNAVDAWRQSLGQASGPVGGGAADMSGDFINPNSDLAKMLEKERKKRLEKQKKEYEGNVKNVEKWLAKSSVELQAFGEKTFADSFNKAEDIFAKLNKEFSEEVAEDFADNFADALDAIEGDFGFTDTYGKYKAFLDSMVEATEQASKTMQQAIVYGISDSLQTLTDGLLGVSELDAKGVFAALLTPMADACITIGELIMATGLANLAFKKSLSNPYAAIAAGAALVGIGALAKSGINKALNGAGSASAASGTSSAGAGSSGTTPTYQGEMTIYVKGEIKGDAIAISGQKAINSWNR